MSADEFLKLQRVSFKGISGTPDYVIEQLHSFASAGVDEVMVQWIGLDDEEGLEILA